MKSFGILLYINIYGLVHDPNITIRPADINTRRVFKEYLTVAEYTVNLTDPLSPPITILPKSANGPGSPAADTSLKLYGAGRVNWGEAVNENFVRLLENFMGATPPENPTAGQLWAERVLYWRVQQTGPSDYYVYDIDYNSVTYNGWVTISVAENSVAPAEIIGTYWFNTTTNELMYFGSQSDGEPATWIPRSYAGGTGVPVEPPTQRVKVYNASTSTWDTVGAVIVSESVDAPAGGLPGTLRYNDITDTLYVWDGVAWQALVMAGAASFSGNVDMNNNSIINVADAVNPQDALNLRTGNSLYVNVTGDTMTGDLTLGANRLNFTNMVLNEGNGSITTAPDIRFGDAGLITADSSIYAIVDDNGIGSGNFIISKGAAVTTGSTALLTVYNNGEVRSNIAAYEALMVDNNSLANKKYVDTRVDTSAAATISTGKHTIWVPAAAITPRPTAPAGTATVEMSSNKVAFKCLLFDAAVDEYAQFSVQMPKSWDESNVTARAVWSHSTGAVVYGVTWAVSAVAFTTGDYMDVAFGGEQYTSSDGGVANALYRSPETAPIVIAGAPTVEDVVVFQLARRVSSPSDTLGIDARLHGVVIYYNTNAVNDA